MSRWPMALARAATILPRGGSPLVRAAAFLFPSLRSCWVPTEYGEVFCDLRERLCFALVKYGRFPHWDHDREFFRALSLGAGSVVFDVGANIGLTARIFARDGATVHAFEPSPRALRMLGRNIAGWPNIIVHPVAVAATSGTLNFHEHPSLDRSSVTESGVPTKAIDLDSLGIVPDLVKIDVEGFEADVLRGARRILVAGTPIFFEALDDPSLADSTGLLHSANPAYRIERVGEGNNYLATVPGVDR